MIKIEEIQKKINDLITSNTSKEDIDKISAISSELDDVKKSMDEANKSYNDLKDDFIKVIKCRNVNNNITDDINNKEDDTPTDLESIAMKVIAERK